MSELKTLPNDSKVMDFINALDNPLRQADSLVLLEIFNRATLLEPKMWGTSIIGYGSYHYKSERSAQEGDWPLVAFSPRKQSLSVYIMPGFKDYKDLLSKLGKHKTSVSCLYINKLADIDERILENLVEKSFQAMKKLHPDFKVT